MSKSKKFDVEKTLASIKNTKILGPLVVIGVIIIAWSTFFSSVENTITFVKRSYNNIFNPTEINLELELILDANNVIALGDTNTTELVQTSSTDTIGLSNLLYKQTVYFLNWVPFRLSIFNLTEDDINVDQITTKLVSYNRLGDNYKILFDIYTGSYERYYDFLTFELNPVRKTTNLLSPSFQKDSSYKRPFFEITAGKSEFIFISTTATIEFVVNINSFLLITQN